MKCLGINDNCPNKITYLDNDVPLIPYTIRGDQYRKMLILLKYVYPYGYCDDVSKI